MLNREENEPLITIEGVWHTYAGEHPVDALRGVDLRIQAGEYVALIGANGSGKSTLARHLNGLLLPTRGRASVAGIDTRTSDRLPDLRRVIQMIFQHPDAQIVATTVEEDVAFGPENFGIPTGEMANRVREALETVGMWDFRGRGPHMLSSGQKQRVAIAGALAVRPRVLVFDEATAMLDPSGRLAVMDLLKKLHAAGTTIITITHEMEEAAETGRVIVLDHGQVAMDGSPRVVFSRAAELRSLGLDLPPVADLALRLNLPVCLTGAELVAALGPAVAQIPHSGSIPPREERLLPHKDAIVSVRGLDHIYLRGTPLETQALRGIEMSLPRGTISGLIGQTGSGKSTLLQHLNGLIRPQTGQVIVDGLDWADPNLDARAARRVIGLLFQQAEDQLFERFVGDDVAFGPRQLKLDHAEIRQRVRSAMDAVGLPFEAFKDRLTQTLSGGEQRRAALAGVLALQPRVLVADEPTAGLDPRGRADILNIFRRINQQGVSLLVASHRMEDIAALCESVVALRGGQVAAAGPTRAVLSQPDMLERHGLPPLPLIAVVNALRSAGWPVPSDALSVPEIAAALAEPYHNQPS